MSQQRNAKQIESLREVRENLDRHIRSFTEKERWRRSWDRSKDFCAEAKRAIQYMELAISALELGEAKTTPVRSGWFSRNVQSLAKHLTTASASEEVEETATIESLAANAKEGFTGDCRVMDLPDLIGMLRAQAKTGQLLLFNDSEKVHLHFQNGDLVHAFSENTPTELRLGEILVEMGSLTADRLQSLLFCHQSSPKMLGQILLEGSLVDRDDLQKALMVQIQGLFDRLFAFREGTSFRFDPRLPDMPENRARLNVLQLLLESARKHDEREVG